VSRPHPDPAVTAHNHTTEAPTYGRDTKAAFLGLILGAIALLVIVVAIVKFTAAKYSHERPAAAEARP
jgi:hypothetical protein